MDQTTYEPDHIWLRPKYTDQGIWTRPHMNQTKVHRPGHVDQTKVHRPKHMDQTRQDKTKVYKPGHVDQIRSDQTRPDHKIQTRLNQTRLKYTDQNQSRPKYIHQIRLYQRLLNPFSAWNNQHIYRETFQGSLRACLAAIFFITKFGDNSCIIEFKQSLKMSK